MKIIRATSATARAPLTSRWAGLIPTGGSGMPAANEGPIEIFIMAILGGFLGLLLGFIAAKVARFVSMLAGVPIGSPPYWSAFGAIAGALAFAIIALVGGD